MVLSKERTSREGLSQLGYKRTGAGQGLTAVSDDPGTPRAGSTGLGANRGNLLGSRALRPVSLELLEPTEQVLVKKDQGFSKLKTPDASSSTVGAPGDCSSTVGAPGAGSSTVGAPGDGSFTVGAPGSGSSTVGAPGEGSSVVGDPIVQVPQIKEYYVVLLA